MKEENRRQNKERDILLSGKNLIATSPTTISQTLCVITYPRYMAVRYQSTNYDIDQYNNFTFNYHDKYYKLKILIN